MFWVTVNKRGLDNLERVMATGLNGEEFTSAILDAAAYHANQLLGELPEAAKGKVQVVISDVDTDSVEINYRPKAGSEASTFQQGPIFIPSSQLGFGSTRRTVISRGGEEGIYATRVMRVGRPSIESYVMKSAVTALPEVNARTLMFATQAVRDAMREFFIKSGVKFNTTLGRYQAPTGGVTLPSGEFIAGGRIITGAF